MARPPVSSATFHYRNRTLILVASPLIAAFSVTRILASVRAGEPWLNWLAGLLLWGFLFLVALCRRLALTPEALEYTEFFSTIRIPWAHVTRLASRRTLRIWLVGGLEGWTESPKPKDVFIDLTQFDPAWRQGPLGSILRSNAPHLFPDSALAQDAPGTPGRPVF